MQEYILRKEINKNSTQHAVKPMRAYVGQKQLPALFKLAGGWTTKEHEIRTGLTAQR